MIQNLWWAAGYNIVAIPLAAGVLASRGIILSPAIGAVLMSASTVIVAINAQLLRRAKFVASRHQIDDTTPRPIPLNEPIDAVHRPNNVTYQASTSSTASTCARDTVAI